MSNVELTLPYEKSERDKLLRAMGFQEKLNTLVDLDEINTHVMPELEQRLRWYLRKPFIYSLLFLFFSLILVPGAIALFFYLGPLSWATIVLILLGGGIGCLSIISLAIAGLLIFSFNEFLDYIAPPDFLHFSLFLLFCIIPVASLIAISLTLMVVMPMLGIILVDFFWTACILFLATILVGTFFSLMIAIICDRNITSSPYLWAPFISLPLLLLLIPIFFMPAAVSTLLIGAAIVLPLCICVVLGGVFIKVTYDKQTELGESPLDILTREGLETLQPQPLLARLIENKYSYSTWRFLGEIWSSFKFISSDFLVTFLLKQGAHPKLIDASGTPYLESFQHRNALYLGGNAKGFLVWANANISSFFTELQETYGWNLFKIDQKGRIPIAQLVKEMGKGAAGVAFSSSLEAVLEREEKKSEENGDALGEEKAGQESDPKKREFQRIKQEVAERVPQLDQLLIEAWKENKEPTALSTDLMGFDYATLDIFPRFQAKICAAFIPQASEKILQALPSFPPALAKLVCSFFFPGYKDSSVEESGDKLEGASRQMRAEVVSYLGLNRDEGS